MTLAYLDFEFSEDGAGHGSFDAMAAAMPAQLAALQAEVIAVLAWAQREFPNRGSVDDGGEWDYELQGTQEVATALDVRYDPGARCLELQPAQTCAPRVTLSLTVSGTAQFCAAFRAAFAVD
jgi:hypothetical protein